MIARRTRRTRAHLAALSPRGRGRATLQLLVAAISCSAWLAHGAAEPPSPARSGAEGTAAAKPAKRASGAAAAPKSAGEASAAKTPAPAGSASETSIDAASKPPEEWSAAPKTTEEARACFQKAQAAYATGDLFGALAGFQCAFEAAPSAELHYNLARVYERMGEAESSTQHYRAYLARAQVTPREKKRIEARLQALQDLRDRQRPPPDATKPSAEAMSAEARSFYERGVKLYKGKQYPAAQAAFNAALQLSNAPELHFNLAVVAERMNHPGEAVDHYRAYLASRTDAKDREEIEERIGMLQTMGR